MTILYSSCLSTCTTYELACLHSIYWSLKKIPQLFYAPEITLFPRRIRESAKIVMSWSGRCPLGYASGSVNQHRVCWFELEVTRLRLAVILVMMSEHTHTHTHAPRCINMHHGPRLGGREWGWTLPIIRRTMTASCWLCFLDWFLLTLQVVYLERFFIAFYLVLSFFSL